MLPSTVPIPLPTELLAPNPPSGLGMGLTAANSEPLLIPKAIRICRLSMALEKAAAAAAAAHHHHRKGEKKKKKKKQNKKKKTVGRRVETRPSFCWRNKPRFFFFAWGAGAFPALALIRSVHEPSLYFIFSWNPKGDGNSVSLLFPSIHSQNL